MSRPAICNRISMNSATASIAGTATHTSGQTENSHRDIFWNTRLGERPAMRILFIDAPSREDNSAPPFGLLYAASVATRLGHKARILDLCNVPLSDSQLIDLIRDFSPAFVGFGGITSSYGSLKLLSSTIRKKFPNLPLIAGGVITSVSELLLTKAHINIVVHAEAETIFPSLLEHLGGIRSLDDVPGISYLLDGRIIKTNLPPQVENMDDIPIPDYSLLNFRNYLSPAEKWLEIYVPHSTNAPNKEALLKSLRGKFLFPMITSRGCTHVCYFCYRHARGLRQHSPGYVIDHMKYLHDNYGVGLFQFNDELTTASRDWVMEFCDGLLKSSMDVRFIVLSARVDNVDEEMIVALKNAGCVMLNYGYETGSQTVMDQVRKGTTIEQAVTAGQLTLKHNILNIPEIIIGFPCETEETIYETISFLKKLNTIPISLNFPMPFPKTMMWKYALTAKLITDEEKFILDYQEDIDFRINLTRYSDETVLNWRNMIFRDVYFNYYFSRHMHLKGIYYWLHFNLRRSRWLVLFVKHAKKILFRQKQGWRELLNATK